jgi:2-oxo-4-hydroxy-4-carboxy-5-ureidoimidazoline decarboxylase
MTLEAFNIASAEAARDALACCCGSRAWVDRMLALRPFPDRKMLFLAAGSVWSSLTPADWLEAFAHHPKIGEKSAPAANARASTWSSQEQKGMQAASPHTASRMQQLNEEYERKFGWIFIICATGKGPDEMLAAIESRLDHDSETELNIAAEEQSKIIQLRLEKLLTQ